MKRAICITFHSLEDEFSIETNALLFNAILLYSVVQKLPNVDVYGLCITSDGKVGETNKHYSIMNVNIQTLSLHEFKQVKPNILLEVMINCNLSIYNYLKQLSPAIKLIKVRYGNSYYIHAHDMIKQQHLQHTSPSPIPITKSEHEPVPTESTWISPHFMKTKDYFKYMFHSKTVKRLPFIWNESSLERRNKQVQYSFQPAFRKNILIMENNLHVIKNSLLPTVIAEAVEQKDSSIISSLHLTCVKQVIRDHIFKDFIQSSQLLQHNKLAITQSYIKLLDFLKAYNIGTVISHTIHNEINYFHLECMKLGIMLVHNSPYHKDYGFYYPEFEIDTARDQVIRAITMSDTEMVSVHRGYQECIDSYRPTNPKTVETIQSYMNTLIDPVPKHYHQTYSNYNNLIPSLQKLIQTNIKTFIGNGWKYSFYNQTERAELIQTHFSPEVFSAYSMLNPEYGPAQADLFRYCLMYHFGGVYTDVKSTIPADILDGLDQTNYDIFVSRWSTRMIGVGERPGEPYTPTGELCNWILISKPKQTFWLDFIHHICNKIRSWDNKLVGKQGVLRLTGPHCLTDFFNVYPKKENIFVFPRSNNKQAFAYDKANYNAIMSSGTAADHKKLFKHHYSTLTTPIVIHSSNTNTVS